MTQPSENGLDAARPIPAPFDAEAVAAWIAGDPDPGAREEVFDLKAQRRSRPVAVITIMKGEQVEPIAREQAKMSVQPVDFGQIEQQPEDAIVQLMRPGPQPPVHDVAAIEG